MSNYKNQSSYSPISRQEGYEKDIIISQLKSEIWELKQQEREYSEIIAHNKNLEGQYQLLKDEKFRIENELKQKNHEQIKQLANYRQRVDQLEQALTERKIEIQELRAENIAQREHCDHKQLEISRLKTEQIHLEDTITRLQNENISIKNELDDLRDYKRKVNSDMELLINTNDNLQSKTLDQDKIIRSLDYEKIQQQRYVDSLKSQITQLENELINKSDNIKDVQNQVIDYKQQLVSLERALEDVEKLREKYKQESLHHQTCLKEEISKNFDLNQQILNLDSNLRSKVNFIDELKRQLDEVKRDVTETLEQNDFISNELERYKRNFDIASAQNAELLRQLEQFNEQDEEIRHILDRKGQVREIKTRVDNYLRQSQNDFRMVSPNNRSYLAASGKHNRRNSQNSASKYE
ncbi:hypothetical protein TTHERM_00128280 (macronuclear) [Tetrahymena thermophila SB210]|uniref:Uncharacterized protein n=1 Tax=Tetrahymena thermophila (strain SB210) TaxID=312017 RepID=I7M1C5_TETTS|nr:hypothetical protein TTHERM_00128280 [Tetrahymena thermophila SB210]EAR96064.2 hypothetical protein TTHERM_00128280 [Tetrahymena thermophila SB210]|eukprot:XP_001016309.2 hypothetical protein TTHERM_00128280 [Tetrahymena thermophila SB210]